MISRIKKLAFVLAILAVLISMTGIILKIKKSAILEKREYQARIEVDNVLGIDVNSTAFTFGALKPGTSGIRSLEIMNSYPFPTQIEILPQGDIAQFVTPQTITLNPGEMKKIKIYANIPKNASLGKFQGNINVIVLKS